MTGMYIYTLLRTCQYSNSNCSTYARSVAAPFLLIHAKGPINSSLINKQTGEQNKAVERDWSGEGRNKTANLSKTRRWMRIYIRTT